MRFFFGLCLAALPAPAMALPADFNARADAILGRDVASNGPGVSAVVSENGRIVWKGAAGRADMATRAPLTSDSIFRYASITKQFTAALVLKLVEEGRLSLDDTLGKLLPTETPAAWHAVTVRQLLNHTSGIPDYTGKPGWMVEANTSQAFTTQALIDITRDMPMDFAPGTKWNYNNTGYVLLSAITEKVTGEPWYVALRKKIIGPLGLTSVRCGCESGPPVVGGFTEGDKVAQRIDMSVPSGAGALVGNASDLARWAAALHGGKVLKPATYQAMITPVGAGASAPLTYAFGLVRGDVRGIPTIGHNGGIFGFNTESLYAPDRKVFVAVLGNSDTREPGADVTARRLLAGAAGAPYPVMTALALDATAVAPYLGVYKLADAERRLTLRDGKLFTQRSGGQALEVFPAGNGRYFYGPKSLSYFDLAMGSDGKPVMTFYSNGALAAQTAPWAGPETASSASASLTTTEQQALAGRYAMGPVVMTISVTPAGLTGQLTGQPPIGLEIVGKREFRTVGVDARLLFEEANGKIARLVLHQNGRTIPFERLP